MQVSFKQGNVLYVTEVCGLYLNVICFDVTVTSRHTTATSTSGNTTASSTTITVTTMRPTDITTTNFTTAAPVIGLYLSSIESLFLFKYAAYIREKLLLILLFFQCVLPSHAHLKACVLMELASVSLVASC